MATARRSKEAESDLISIWLHIAEQDAEAADRVLDFLEKEFERLSRAPRKGRERRDFWTGVRCFVAFKPSWRSRYLVFYREISDGIEIARVLEGHRDVPEALGGE